jgi:hypothetical protein
MMTFPQKLVILIVLVLIALVMWSRLRIVVAVVSIAVALGIAQFAGLEILEPVQSPSNYLLTNLPKSV